MHFADSVYVAYEHSFVKNMSLTLLLYYRIFPKCMIGRLLSHDNAVNSVVDITVLKFKKNYKFHYTKN